MKKEELQQHIDRIKWFHRIELPYDEGGTIITPGILDEKHCSKAMATMRFGMPKDLTGKSVLDIGCNQGFFSFVAEKRGAVVTAIDPNQGDGDNISGLMLAKTAIQSHVNFIPVSLKEFYSPIYVNHPFDITLYYGVLYHVDAPLDELKYLSRITKEMALIETAIGPGIEHNDQNLPIWHLRPGYDGDDTNKWYPSVEGLRVALLHVGFKKVELIYMTEGYERVTVRALK